MENNKVIYADSVHDDADALNFWAQGGIIVDSDGSEVGGKRHGFKLSRHDFLIKKTIYFTADDRRFDECFFHVPEDFEGEYIFSGGNDTNIIKYCKIECDKKGLRLAEGFPLIQENLFCKPGGEFEVISETADRPEMNTTDA